jgi:hypothetical protein
MMRVQTVAQTMTGPTRRHTVMQMRIRLMAIRRSEMVTSARGGSRSPSPFRKALPSFFALRSSARSLPARSSASMTTVDW